MTESVNSMANQPQRQVRNIAEVHHAVANGTWSKKITVTSGGEILQLKESHQTPSVRPDVRSSPPGDERVARDVAPTASLGGQGSCPVSPALEGPHRLRQCDVRQPHRPGANIANVTTAVCGRERPFAQDPVTCARNPGVERDTIQHDATDSTRSLPSDARRARVGTEGTIGGQARCRCRRPWKDLTDNVNFMASI